LSLFVDNTQPPNGSVEAAGLAAGASNETCIHTTFPASGQHQLRLVVDQFRAVAEMNEQNNALTRSFRFGGVHPPVGGGEVDPGAGTNPDPGTATR